MPVLTFKGISKEEIVLESKEVVDKLVEIVECPRDYFKLEVDCSLYIRDGEYVEGPSMIEVSWFDRGQEVQDKVAQLLTDYFRKDREWIDVVFNKLEKSSYYENGKHF